ncbi:hypothetical protein DL240_11255 [Lujinxingia litoralis]|uniref:HTH luxR-type domain-containing protein n=1 Tax=Lujinxingia litoralis TaxID=2211119 RepID=A0A328CB29_9DELT|nr:helix-turn-helix transcriptional regulator [Lujinxingia litoralis]RAL22417.1 hypothetical protein DL240_11255 [Lujinxingia litoralis]
MNEATQILAAREEDARQHLVALIEELQASVGAAGGIFAEVRQVEGALHWARPVSCGAGGWESRIDGESVGEELAQEIQCPAERDFCRFTGRCDRGEVHPEWIAALSGASDMAGLLVYRENALVGWLGLLRHVGTYAAAELAALSEWVGQVGDVVRAYGWAVDQAQAGYDGLSLIYASDGRLLYQTQALPPSLRVADLERMVRHGEPVASRVVRGGWVLRVRLLAGASGAGRLVEVAPARRAERAPDFALTPMQRRVAEYACSGATIAEIARAMERSPHTIKTHLKHAYERLGVASRLELAARLG